MKLLFLEDSTVLSRAVQLSLMKDIPKLEVHTAESIAEAEDFFRYDSADVLLVDVHLPDGNGIDFLCDVRTAYPSIPAIVMTSSTQPAIRQRAENVGVVQFLEKPVTMSTLNQAVLDAQCTIQDTTRLSREELFYVIANIPILDFIQGKCRSGATIMLHISDGGGKTGKVYIDNGRITHAEAEGKIGVAGLCEMIDWITCEVIDMKEELAPCESIKGDWITATCTALCASEGQNESVTLALAEV